MILSSPIWKTSKRLTPYKTTVRTFVAKSPMLIFGVDIVEVECCDDEDNVDTEVGPWISERTLFAVQMVSGE